MKNDESARLVKASQLSIDLGSTESRKTKSKGKKIVEINMSNMQIGQSIGEPHGDDELGPGDMSPGSLNLHNEVSHLSSVHKRKPKYNKNVKEKDKASTHTLLSDSPPKDSRGSSPRRDKGSDMSVPMLKLQTKEHST